MCAHAIAGLRLRRRVRTTIPEPADQRVPDLLRRDFTAAAPNQRYVRDITYLPLADGSNLYLATVIDCFSRRLAGWAIAEHMRTDLVTDALGAARDTRGSLTGAIFHSDHGAQAVQREDLRPALPATRRDPVDGRGRHQRRQRAGRVVQRLAQARDAAGRARLVTPLIGQTLDDRASPKAGEPRVGVPIAVADTVERRAGRSIRCGNGGHQAGRDAATSAQRTPLHRARGATASAH
jgi:hypothetical protein